MGIEFHCALDGNVSNPVSALVNMVSVNLTDIMDALHISKVFVLGVAYGARTAVQFALRHEGKLKA